jgi:amino acid adenylation domain-containing protein
MLMTDANSLPLSYSQQGLRVVYLENTQSAAYNMALPLQFSESPNAALLHKAFTLLYTQHETLRSRFYEIGGVAYQAFDAELQNAWQEVDATGWNDDVLMSQVHHYLQQPFILENSVFRATFFTGAASGDLLLLALHHIAGDLTSLNIFGKQLVETYHALLAKGEISLPLNEQGYGEFVHWEKARLHSKFGQRMSTYWQNQLSGDVPVLQLQTDFPRPPLQTFNGASFHFDLPKNVLVGINAFANKNKTTLFSVLLSAYQTLLHRYTGQPAIWIAVPTSTPRTLPVFKEMVGYLVNPMIITADFGNVENLSFIQLLQRTNKQILTGLYHQPYPFIELVNQLHTQHDPSYPPLIQTMFALAQEDLFARQFIAGQTQATRRDLAQMEGQFDVLLTWFDSEDGETLTGTLSYNRDLFKPETIQKMAQHMLTLLHGVVTQADAPLHTLPLLTPAEQQQLQAWNNTATDYSQHQTIVSLFEAQVERTPNHTAVVFADQQLTYQQLNQQANQVAYALLERGVRVDTLVGLCVERSLNMIVGLLGILKAGGAYVPLDPEYPAERLRYMLSDCAAKLLLTQRDLQDKLTAIIGDAAQQRDCELLCLDVAHFTHYSCNNPPRQAQPHHLAYVIYTSGSTGQPKGVMIEHHGLYNLARTHIDTFEVHANSHVLQFVSPNFDVSVAEWSMTLGAGASLYLASRDTLMPGDALQTTVQHHAITHILLSPAALTVMSAQAFTPVSHLIVGGEACPVELVAEWSAGRKFFNAYGPTEAAVCATVALCQHPRERLPIGKPLPNVRVYVLDAQQQLVPVGVPGELCIAGSGLARGYLNRAELTAEKFIIVDICGRVERLYRTGDLVRWLPDGNVMYLGRIDHQVKLRGFRIELGEIETVLEQQPGIREAVVVLCEAAGHKRLAAYLTLADNAGQNATFSVRTLRAALTAQLPDYMIPSSFTVLECLPLTLNGKVDRQALPAPDDGFSEHVYVAPQTATEQKLVDIWSEVFKRDGIGIHDNFFELGGSSIIGIQIATKARQVGLLLNPRDVFLHQTVAELVRWLQEDKPQDEVSHLVPINPTGSRIPLYFLPGAGGYVMSAYPLAAHLGEDQPLFGLQTPGVEGETDIPDSVETHANILLQTLLSHRPNGPYRLAGYSSGGKVAYELARRLEQAGHKVVELIIFGTENEGSGRKFTPEGERKKALELIKTLNKKYNIELGFSPEAFAGVDADTIRAQVIQHVVSLNLMSEAEAEQFQRQIAVIRQAIHNHAVYTCHAKLACAVKLFRCSQDDADELSDSADAGWQRYSHEPITVHWINAHHENLLEEPHVQVIAAYLVGG